MTERQIPKEDPPKVTQPQGDQTGSRLCIGEHWERSRDSACPRCRCRRGGGGGQGGLPADVTSERGVNDEQCPKRVSGREGFQVEGSCLSKVWRPGHKGQALGHGGRVVGGRDRCRPGVVTSHFQLSES